jgi:undecaprenyl-diphosphatase
MTWWQAVILGVIEGLTEYLPVSSTGHLLIIQNLLGIGTQDTQARVAANAYAICMQTGAIAAVLGLYWQRVKQGIVGMVGFVGIGPGDSVGLRLFQNLVIAFLPAAIVGLILDDLIEQYLFSAWTIVAAWFAGGIAILVVTAWKKKKSGDEHVGKELDQLSWRMALIIGVIQCLAMMPGTSRSLVTIVAGILVGLSIASAVEFSFLLGVVTLFAATLYKAFLDTAVVTIDGQEQEVMLAFVMVEEYGWAPMIAGAVSAYIAALVAVKWMVGYLKKHGMAIFGYYRIAIAIVAAGLILAGYIQTHPPQ